MCGVRAWVGGWVHVWVWVCVCGGGTCACTHFEVMKLLTNAVYSVK